MKTIWNNIKLVALIFLGASAAYAAADPSVVREKIAAGALILDVRTPEEFEAGNYPGALNKPVQVLKSRLPELGDRGRPIVVYCRSGRRSEIARGILLENGFTDVTNAGSLGDMRAAAGK